jgi:hypothetical protein
MDRAQSPRFHRDNDLDATIVLEAATCGATPSSARENYLGVMERMASLVYCH